VLLGQLGSTHSSHFMDQKRLLQFKKDTRRTSSQLGAKPRSAQSRTCRARQWSAEREITES
jgi:hypothetical protein